MSILAQLFQGFSAASTSPAPTTDSLFNYVSLLLNGESVSYPGSFITDVSTNKFIVTPVGAPRHSFFNPFNGDGYYSTYLNGSTDYLSATVTAPTTGDWTFEGWYNFTTVKNSGLFQLSTGVFNGVSGFGVGIGSDLKLMVYYAGTQYGPIGSALTNNRWYHVAACKTAGNIKLYIDGVLFWSVADSYNYNFTTMGIGGIYSTAYTMHGYVSNFRFVGGTAIYTKSFAVPTSPLLATSNTRLLTCQSAMFKDTSANNLTITTAGSPTISSMQPYSYNTNTGIDGNYSIKFNKTNYVSVPSTATGYAGDFTIELWINPTDTTYGAILGDTGNLFVLDREVTTGIVRFWIGGTYITTTAIAPVGTWTHVAVVRQGTTITQYVNGVASGTTSSLGTVGSGNLYFGARGDLSFYYAGYISNLRVVNGSAVYTSNFTPSTTPLAVIANTALLTAQSATIKDNSANTLTLTVTGIPELSGMQPYAGIESKTNSVYFRGTPDYAYASSAVLGLSANFTIEMWINPVGTAYGAIIGDVGNTFLIQRNATTNVVQVYMGGSPVGTGTAAPNVWTHIAYVRSGTTGTVYINGVASGTGTVSGTVGSGNLYFGARADLTFYYNGYISNLRIVKGTAVYTGNFTPSTTPLTAIAGTTLLTCQGNIADMTVAGAPVCQLASPFIQPGFVQPTSNGSTYFPITSSLQVPAAASVTSGDFTVEFWLNPTPFGSSYRMIFANDTAGGFSSCINSTGTITYGRSLILTDGTTTTSVKFNQWNHIAYVRQGTSFAIYINGVAGLSVTNTTTYTSGITRIGTDGGGSAFPYDGYISNFRIVKGTAVYTSNFIPPTSPLTAITNTSVLTLQTPGVTKDTTMTDYGTLSLPITTNAGSPTTGSFSPYGTTWGTYFDGSSVLTAPTSAGFSLGSTYTVEMWMYPTAYPSGAICRVIMIGANGANTAWCVNFDSAGGLNFGIPLTGTTGCTAPAGTVELNKWQHIAFVVNGTSGRIYKNGASIAGPSTVTTQAAAAPGILIGREPTPTVNAYYTGYISNLRIVKGTAVYTSNFTPSTTPLTAIAGTTLLTCNTNRFQDSSANALAVTVSLGTPVTQSNSPFTPQTTYSPSTNSGSILFTSPNDYITAPANPGYIFTGDHTLEAWVYPTAAGADECIYATGGASSSDQFLFTPGNGTGKIAWAYGIVGGYLTTTANIPYSTWTHLAVSRVGTTLKAFVNGIQVYSGTVNGTIGQNVTAYTGMRNDNVCFLSAYISDLRVTNGTGLYTTNFTPPALPLRPVPGTVLLITGKNTCITDYSSKNNLFTVSGATITNSRSKYGTGSLMFNGSTDYALTTTNPTLAFGTGNFTIEAWVYRRSNGGSSGIFTTCNNTATGSAILGTDASGAPKFTILVNTTAVDAIGPSALTLNTWHHIAGVRNGTTITLYVDGVQVATNTNATTSFYADRTVGVIGRYYTNVNNFYWDGYIDDLRVTQGIARYTANFTVPSGAFPTK